MTEFELIAHLTEGSPRAAPDLLQGVDDDCAVIAGPAGRDWLVTTDALVEGVHFRRQWTDPRTLGRKALAANQSDIAAMGGTPRFYLVSISIPEDIGEQDVMELYAGMRERADSTGIILIGGDTSASRSGLLISITMIGDIESGHAILRSRAAAGDGIYVTGTFGSAALGFRCLEAARRDDMSAPFIRRHLDPVPRLEAGRAFAGCGMVSAMIDVSDGLLADLAHIALASNRGFEIEERLVPREPGFEGLARELNEDPAGLLLGGGEEYELIFTVRSDRVSEFERDVKPLLPVFTARVGTMLADRHARIVRAADGKELRISRPGFDHFARKGR